MNTNGRVSICGFISQYNSEEPPKGTNYLLSLSCLTQINLMFHLTYVKAQPVRGLILFKQLTVRGFMVTGYLERWPEAFKEIEQWIQEVSYM